MNTKCINSNGSWFDYADKPFVCGCVWLCVFCPLSHSVATFDSTNFHLIGYVSLTFPFKALLLLILFNAHSEMLPEVHCPSTSSKLTGSFWYTFITSTCKPVLWHVNHDTSLWRMHSYCILVCEKNGITASDICENNNFLLVTMFNSCQQSYGWCAHFKLLPVQ